ncbi:hypothetical protein OEZ86_009131 [Tetradesmus obliquus]|nr:hypothetical protein OEZ86_009131 [Tetradesmus obliquus]
MLPISEAELQQVLECGWLREVAFKTEPRVNKLEIKAFLEAVHGMQVERVSTINYQGRKQRIIDSSGKPHYRRLSDWKKAYVIFEPPPEKLEEWQNSKQRQQELLRLSEQQQRLQRDQRQFLASLKKLPEEQQQQKKQQREEQRTNGWIHFTKITASAATVTQWTPAPLLDSQRNSTLHNKTPC